MSKHSFTKHIYTCDGCEEKEELAGKVQMDIPRGWFEYEDENIKDKIVCSKKCYEKIAREIFEKQLKEDLEEIKSPH